MGAEDDISITTPYLWTNRTEIIHFERKKRETSKPGGKKREERDQVPTMPLQHHGLTATDVHAKIKLLISNLVNIKDTSGKFLLKLDDGRVIDTKSWNGWEWTHGVGLYGLWKYFSLTGDEEVMGVMREWFAVQLKEGTTRNINTVRALQIPQMNVENLCVC